MKFYKIIGFTIVIELFCCIWLLENHIIIANGQGIVLNASSSSASTSVGGGDSYSSAVETSNTTKTPVDVYCPQLNGLQSEFGTYAFPKTLASTEGVLVRLDCAYRSVRSGAESIFGDVIETEHSGATSICYARRNETGHYYGQWSPISVKNCKTSGGFQRINQFTTQVVNAETVTANTMRQIIPSLVYLLADAVKDFESAQLMIETISRFLEITEVFATTKDDEIVAGWRRELFETIDKYVQNVQIKPGQRVLLTKGHIEVESVYFPSNLDSISSYGFEKFVNISREAIINGTRNGSRLLIQAYDNDLFYLWGNERIWDDDDNDYDDNSNINDTDLEDEMLRTEGQFRGKWRVIDITFDGEKIENLDQPITYTLPINWTSESESNFTWKCAFWNQTEGKWSSEGMTTTILDGEIRCESTHLTAFSALIEPIPYSRDNNGVDSNSTNVYNIPPIHLHILSVLSSVGSALSIAGLAMTTLTYALFRCLRKERSNKILLNLSTSLLLLHLMSVSSEVDMWDGQCLVPALLLHYFLLTSLNWMLVEGVHMYQLLILVFVKPESRFLTKRSLLAWGIPLILVIISVIVDKNVYSAGRNDSCIMAGHLNLPLYYTTYLAPVIICICINTFIFIRIARVLYVQSSKTRKQQMMTYPASSSTSTSAPASSSSTNSKTDNKLNNLNRTEMKSLKSYHLSPVQIKGALTVMILLGVGWTFGLLAVGPFQIVFRYFFTICNAGQGVLIFLFRVVLHPQACRTWRKAVLSSSGNESEIFSSSTSSTNTNHNTNKKGHVSRPSFSVSPAFASSASNSVDNTLNKTDTITKKLATTLLNLIQSNKDATNTNVIKKEDTNVKCTFD